MKGKSSVRIESHWFHPHNLEDHVLLSEQWLQLPINCSHEVPWSQKNSLPIQGSLDEAQHRIHILVRVAYDEVRMVCAFEGTGLHEGRHKTATVTISDFLFLKKPHHRKSWRKPISNLPFHAISKESEKFPKFLNKFQVLSPCYRFEGRAW